MTSYCSIHRNDKRFEEFNVNIFSFLTKSHNINQILWINNLTLVLLIWPRFGCRKQGRILIHRAKSNYWSRDELSLLVFIFFFVFLFEISWSSRSFSCWCWQIMISISMLLFVLKDIIHKLKKSSNSVNSTGGLIIISPHYTLRRMVVIFYLLWETKNY